MTTSEFTASAKEFAQDKPTRLLDLDDLLLTGTHQVSTLASDP